MVSMQTSKDSYYLLFNKSVKFMDSVLKHYVLQSYLYSKDYIPRDEVNLYLLVSLLCLSFLRY